MPSFEREASSRGKYIKVPRIFMPKASCKAAWIWLIKEFLARSISLTYTKSTMQLFPAILVKIVYDQNEI